MRSDDSGSWLTTAVMMIGLAVLCCLGFILTVGGCTSDVCSRGSDCANGLICSTNSTCVKPPIDAPAAKDGGGTDATTTTPDAATTDAAIDGGP
jgi:hypothetical protein